MVGTVPAFVIMKEPIVVSGDITVYDLAKLLVDEKRCSVIVVSTKDKNIKVARTDDILNKVLVKKLPPEAVKASEIASNNIVTVPPETSIEDVIKLMKDKKAKEIFVINENGEIEGVITKDDIIDVTPELIATLKDLVEYLLSIINETLSEDSQDKAKKRILQHQKGEYK